MSGHPRLFALERELRAELTQRILPYWMEHAPDERYGGFVGGITAANERLLEAPRGAVLNARILWTFAAAYRALGDPALRALADRAADYVVSRFLDPVHGGCVWMLEANGSVLDGRKHVYAQAFLIYALAEHFAATGDERSIRYALDTFHLLERHARDRMSGGYREAFRRDWQPLDDVRLSDRDARAPRSMNTHLHLLEAYTALSRVSPEPLARDRLRALLRLFLDRIIDSGTSHLHAFFDDDWSPSGQLVSYGHDIEASWLLVEAAELLDGAALRTAVRTGALSLADAVLSEGFEPGCGVSYERRGGAVAADREWWVQAEAIVGFTNAYLESGRAEFMDAAWDTWTFTREHVRDTRHGEWHRRVATDGTVREGHEKVGPWKGPYHNARACLSIMQRAVRVIEREPGALGVHAD